MPTTQAEQHCINVSTTVTVVIKESKATAHTFDHSGEKSIADKLLNNKVWCADRARCIFESNKLMLWLIRRTDDQDHPGYEDHENCLDSEDRKDCESQSDLKDHQKNFEDYKDDRGALKRERETRHETKSVPMNQQERRKQVDSTQHYTQEGLKSHNDTRELYRSDLVTTSNAVRAASKVPAQEESFSQGLILAEAHKFSGFSAPHSHNSAGVHRSQ